MMIGDSSKRNFLNIQHYGRLIVVMFLFVAVSAPASAQSEQGAWLPTLDALSSFRDRPLFSPSRRPPSMQAPLAVPEEQAVVSDELLAILVGIISDEAGHGFALIQDSTSGEHLRVAKDSLFNGWLLTSLTRHSAIFEREGRTVELSFVSKKEEEPDPVSPEPPLFPNQFPPGKTPK